MYIKKFIKYEELSSDIKSEIDHFHSCSGGERCIDDSMSEWFENRFDEWLSSKYMQGDSRRRHFRINVEIPLKIIDTLIESSGEDADAMELVGNVVNISKGGLYFKYVRPIELSSIIKVLINLSGIDPEIESVEALAMVVRVDLLDDNSYGIGIVFSSIYDFDRINLNMFILKNLSNFLYNS